MNLRLLHRRLAMSMALAALVAFVGSAGVEPVPAALAGSAYLLSLFWRPTPGVSARLERLWVPLAVVLVLRALLAVFLTGGDVVIPVVDLLLLLLAAEGLRSLDARNGIRIYALSFALILASSAYRPGILFGVAFVAFVSLGTMALTVGHLLRSAERRGLREAPVGRRLLGGLSLLSLATLVLAGLVFIAFPRASRGWSGRGQVLATSIAGFSSEVSLDAHGARILPNPEVVLRVEMPEGRPDDLSSMHWKGRSYDRFDGVRWIRSRSLPPALAPPRWYRERWPDTIRQQRIYAARLEERVLFTLHPVVDVEPRSGIQPVVDDAGDLSYWGSDHPAYDVVSMARRPSAEQLRAVSDARGPADRWYLQLPDLPFRIPALADSLAEGLSTRYDRAAAVERWLRSSFEYTLQLPATEEEASLEHFLFERRAGHCEYFSTAMVVLLRSQGIPARNVNGFLGAEWNEYGGYAVVTQNQAHSWVEVWFPSYGWVAFDPTPAGAGAGRAASSWLGSGRMLFDGLSHRWGKWVLDFSPEEQAGLFGGLREMLGRDEPPGREDGGPGGLSPLLWALLLAVGSGTALVLLVRRGPATSAESRLYLRLRSACADAGFPVGASTPPGELVERLRAAGHPAGDPAGELVERYRRARFGGRGGDPESLDAMRAALREASRRLRTRSTPPGADPRGA